MQYEEKLNFDWDCSERRSAGPLPMFRSAGPGGRLPRLPPLTPPLRERERERENEPPSSPSGQSLCRLIYINSSMSKVKPSR